MQPLFETIKKLNAQGISVEFLSTEKNAEFNRVILSKKTGLILRQTRVTFLDAETVGESLFLEKYAKPLLSL